MNPADVSMMWMNQFHPDSQNTAIFQQPAFGMSVMDDIVQHANSMDMNSIPIGSDLNSGLQITDPDLDLIHDINEDNQGAYLTHMPYQITTGGSTAIQNNGLFNSNLVHNSGFLMSAGTNPNSDQLQQMNTLYEYQAQLMGNRSSLLPDDDNDNDNAITTGGFKDVDDDDEVSGISSDGMQIKEEIDLNEYQQKLSIQQMNALLMGTNSGIPSQLISNNQLELIQQPMAQYQISYIANSMNENNSSTDGNSFDGNNKPVILQEPIVLSDTSGVQENSNGSYHYEMVGGKKILTSNQVNRLPNTTQSSKKIKPIKRPGLVLKTPIAYQPCQDPSVIPIHRDGMAVCERCGAIGVKHSFYTKERNFCSMACARGKHGKTELGRDKNDDGDSDEVLSTMDSEYDGPIQKSNYRFKISDQDTETSNSLDDEKSVLFRDVLPQEELPELAREDTLLSPCPQEERILSVRHKPSEFVHSYDWTPMLNKNNGIFAAPVTCFPHAPGYDMWDNIIGPSGVINNKVEVENTDVDNQGITATTGPHSFWVATVLKVCGYKALLRYEGFDTDSSHDLWVNLCSSEVHPVGWCATRGKPLIPPQTIELKYSDWKEFLVKRLSGASTLPSTFYNKISDSFKSRFKCGMNLEVVDKNCISKVKLATIQKIIGKRLFFHYYDSPSDDGFWCHEDSPLIHPVGWAATVGHKLSAPSSYIKRMQAGRDQIIESNENDTTYDLFKINFTFEEYSLSGRKSRFQQGMKLEAIDPLNLSSICVATVMSVLKYGYMMIRIDSYDPDVTGSDWFCYHEHSPCIFPPGFCQSNDIILTPPKGYSAATFEWNRYLHDTKSIPATRDLFNLEIPKHGFEEGMKVECADLMDPRLVCVATISRVVGRLLKVHFDGWEEEYDQWLDCESPDMYPVGWCFLVGHKLEEPKAPPPVPKPLGRPLGRRRKKEKKKAEGVKTGKSPVSGIVKKEHDDTRGSSVSSDSTRGNTSIKQEIKLEAEDDDEYEDEYSESGQSTSTTYTIATPEPLPAGSNRRSAGSYSNINTTPGIQSQAPPQERKVTSYINSSSVNTGKYIPQINASSSVTGSSNSGNSITESCPSDGTDELCPDTWNIYDVSQFLRVNDCTAHCETFSRHKVDGKKLLALTKDEIITMLGNRLGPAIKIFVLIQELNKLVTKELKKKRSKEYL